MKLRSALLAATILVAPVAAKAQAISGLYIGAGAGANFMSDEKVTSTTIPGARIGLPSNGSFPGSSVRLDTGYVGVASIGYGLGNGLRFEVEGGYRSNKFSGVKGGIGSVSAGGDEHKYSGMFNVLYDFDPALIGGSYLPFPINPYIGIGAGYAWVQDQNTRLYGNTGSVPGASGGLNNTLRTNAGQGNFAYQAIVGSAFPIAAVPGLSLTVEYRFFGVLDRTYNYQYFSTAPIPVGTATRASLKYTDDYNHSVMVGVRYAFNAAPPIVQPLAPEVRAIQRTYLVFFDWDRADLTDRARQIVAAAAQATTQVQVTRIEVSGNTDTSGTAAYNQRLSERRAQNVAAELVRLGVPRAAITTVGNGFRNLLVATGPGVREPQNRRVEIVLR